jgi:RNA polymerase sigma-70 factor, ECF subfamily
MTMSHDERIERVAVHVPESNITQPDHADVMAMLEEVFTLHKQDLFSFCYRRLDDVEQANDACGRIMLKALKSIESFTPHPERPGATLRAWLFWIARNDLIDFQRTQKWTHSLDRLDHAGNRVHDPADMSRGPAEELLAREADQRVHTMLRFLPDSQRAIVELRLAGLRGDEIAQTLGMTLSAVKSAQYRAYQRLRDLLSDDGVR